ncbi:MAG: DNA internalization-related competence protein ComEC/Rec2 [Lachnospiraceae bacterium]|nr:DNA internalization-related competence protein ComEC/Rec2 [Lachnospiraceae bacterium]
MRRPLCLVCVAFVVSVFISLQMASLPNSMKIEDGSEVIYTGEVYHKEYGYYGLILYLRNVNHVSSTNIPINDLNLKEDTGILCYIEKGKEPRLGSNVLVSGTVACFRSVRNPGGFDQEMYYRIQNIGLSLKKVEILAESSTYSKYYEGLYRLRRRMESVFEKTMSEKDAAIMKAMILGNKTELDKESKQLYQRSGISHILAISGLHISLIGMGLYKLLKKMRVPVVLSTLLAVAVMIMYGDMVGSSASAFRAIFMFALKMGAEVLHRTYDMLTALALAAVGILLEQPLYIYHAGFLLSFGAIVGIGCMYDVLKTDTKQIFLNKRIQKRREYRKNLWCSKVRESLLGSGSIFLIHFPIMLSVYYEFPIYSFILNMLIIPAMSLVMAMGLGCMLTGGIGDALASMLFGKVGGGSELGIICEGVAQLFAYGCQVCLRIFEILCEWSMELPGASWIVGEPETWRIVIFYVVVLSLFIIHKNCKYTWKNKICLPFPVKMMWILVAVALLTQKTYDGLTITMLDVGQGDCIWIETDTGHHYLIDGGSTSEKKLGEYTLIPFLKQTGTAEIDAVFLTHLDKDHTSGVLELLEGDSGIKVHKIVIAKAVIRDESYEELVALCRTKHVAIMYAEAGDVLKDDKLQLEVLHPSADYVTDSRNAYSLVMKLEYGGFHALFTGDVEEDGENLVVNSLPENWECHLYKVAHHGSRNSNTLALLEQIKPKLAIISCEEDNSYGHPHEETLERLSEVGSKVMVTKDCGAIIVEVDERIKVKRWIEGE